MERRAFLSGLAGNKAKENPLMEKSKRDKILAGLDTYSQPLDRAKAYHLLRRTTFGPTPEMVDEYTGKTASEVLTAIMGTGNEELPDAGFSWVDTQEENPLEVGNTTLRSEIESRLKARYSEFCNWWAEQMRTADLQLREKLTHFWSMTWTINFNYDTLALIPPPLIYRNNQTLRGDALGLYTDFAEDITLDGAMLLFQSLYYSSGEEPNENYMRELMELFTMGISYKNQFNYTEGDIKEGSRVLTGWRTACYAQEPKPNGEFNSYFLPEAHDIGEKVFMGTTIPARTEGDNNEDLVKEQEVRGLINILFDQRGESIGAFVSENIYNYFVFSSPGDFDEDIVDALTQVFLDNDYEMKPVFEKILTSEHFFDDANIGIQIKTPPEFIVGLERQLGITYSGASNAIAALEQILYNPPDVGGWDEYRGWISTTTYPLRVKYAMEMLAQVADADLVLLAKKFTGYTDSESITASLAEYFLSRPLDSARLALYKAELLDGGEMSESDWTSLIEETANAKVVAGLRNLISKLFHAPDFQLC